MNFKNALQMISIKKYNGTPQEIKNGQFRFFIQAHGFNAGRPLRSPKTNCWEFISEREADFEILYIIFESKILQSFIRGSVIPFIALIDYKNIIAPILQKAIHENRIINEHYLQLRKIEQQTANQEKIIKLLQEMKITVSRQAYKKITAQ